MNVNQEVLGALAALVVAVVPLVRAWVQARLNSDKIATVVYHLAPTAVKAAEQLALDVFGVPPTGALKFNFASDLLVASAKRVGLKLSTDEVLGYIHAALRDMQQAEKPVPAAA